MSEGVSGIGTTKGLLAMGHWNDKTILRWGNGATFDPALERQLSVIWSTKRRPCPAIARQNSGQDPGTDGDFAG